jgi:hypothetical protein
MAPLTSETAGISPASHQLQEGRFPGVPSLTVILMRLAVLKSSQVDKAVAMEPLRVTDAATTQNQ